MKRRTWLILVSCMILGSAFTSANAAFAMPLPPAPHVTTPEIVNTEILWLRAVVDPRQAPDPQVVVQSGDTLWAIGIRTQRTWEQLAGYNKLADPDLITVGEVIKVPPTGYAAPAVVPAIVTVQYNAPVQHVQPSYSSPVVPVAPATSGSGIWSCIAYHESGNTNDNTGNGYYGYFQFDAQTWQSNSGLPGVASDYSYATQLAVAEKVQSQRGWQPWPNTSVACGV